MPSEPRETARARLFIEAFFVQDEEEVDAKGPEKMDQFDAAL